MQHQTFLRETFEKADRRTLSEQHMLDFVKHHEGLRSKRQFEGSRRNKQFETAQAIIVEQALALASNGGSHVARLGTKTDMVYVNTGDRIHVIDPARREILSVSEERANAMLGASLLEHVHQEPSGARFFSAYPTMSDDLVFIIGGGHVKIPYGELTQHHVQALADVLISTTPGNSDVIFTAQPQLLAVHRERIRDALFRVAAMARSRGRRVLMDDLSTTTLQRAAMIRNAQLQDSMVAYIANSSFDVVDGQVVQNLEEQLVTGGVRVIHVDAEGDIGPSAESVAVVITGHSDKELGRFVSHLNSQNALRGKMVIFNSCRTKLTEELVRDMIHHGGSIGVYHFDGTILASQVRGFLRQVLKHRQDGNEPSLMKSVESSSTSSQLNGLWQISRAEHSSKYRDEHV